MIKKNAKGKREQKRYADLVGIDFSTTATKVVRMKSNKGNIVLVGIDMLPAIDLNENTGRMELPRSMVANYGCLTYSGSSAIIRMVSAPLAAEEETLPEAKLRELLNVDDDFRASAMLMRRGKGRADSSLLAAAIPQSDARCLLNMFPVGPPAPASIEISGLSFVSAFLNARKSDCTDQAICLIEAGESSSHYVFLNKGVVALVGKMAFGAKILRQKLVEDLGVDDELANTILLDRSINISASLVDVTGPFMKQLSISRDFMERHQGCRVSKVYLSGGLSLLPNWSAEVGRMLQAEVENWSPLENLQYSPDTIPQELETQATRFAAAIGAAIGGFEQT